MAKKGFIVHPFETGDSKYHASYGNHNKTVRSFNTLKEAKAYLRKNNLKSALYDHPSGAKDVKIIGSNTRKSKPKPKNPFNFDLGF